IVAEATKDDPDAQKAVQAGLRLVEGILGSALDLGFKGTATGLRLGAAELARIAEERARALETRRHTLEKLKGGVLDMPITRDGEVVGQINARLNLAQVFHSVLSMTRSDQGEIPFAIDGQRRIYTLQPGDRARLETLGLRSGGTAVERDDWIVVRSHDPSGMVFGIARPIGAGLADIRRTAVRNLGLGLSFILIALVGIVPLSSGMTRNLKTLTDGVHRLAGGDLRTRVLVRSRDEFGLLAQAFNQMTEDLQRHQKAAVEQERLRSELQLCRQIQTEMLPHERLRLGLTEVKGVSIPAREVGGDFFNYFAVGEDQVALLVGDVSGKGVGAALLMANIQATLRARLPLERDLKQLVDAIDRDVERNTPRGVFITLFVGILDLQAKTMRYVNAGHHPQFVLRREGGLDRLPGTGLPVGLFAGHGYEEQAVTLADGDLLFFYTDGMVEAESDTGDMFSTERLEALLLRAHNDGIDDLLARIESEVQQFRGGAEPFDDATMMALRVA
ncbi:MAG TPA: SpoIIE family protein phosphatase, partial [Candidatus Limnocylindrales bacterium]|nr:SpoIIE family protein phosphatase [Candidatus Limnocylindrales bacterium]